MSDFDVAPGTFEAVAEQLRAEEASRLAAEETATRDEAAKQEAARLQKTKEEDTKYGNLTQQILGQGLTGKWSGQGHGSAEANARDMARILSEIGITDIRQFGEIQVPEVSYSQVYKEQSGTGGEWGEAQDTGKYYAVDAEGNKSYVDPSTVAVNYDESGVPQYALPSTTMRTTYGNKETGQVVPTTYSERQTGNAWGGTFEGKGNTGYRVSFAPDGTPIFYTTGASSNDLVNMLDNPILMAAAQLGAAYFGGPAGTAALQAAMGKDIGDIAKSAALSYIGGQVASGVSGMEGVADTLGQTGANIAGKVAGAAVTGRDPVAALVSGGAGAALKEAGSYLRSYDFEPDSFEYGQVFDPAAAGLVNLSEQPLDQNYQFTTDFGVGADYGLGPKSDGQGFQVTAPPEVFNKDGSVNYDLLDYSKLSELGMDMPKTPNLDDMGGGQGLRVPVAGGYITEQGFIPEGYTPNLGDPNSFINKPAPGGDVSIKGALNAGAAATSAGINKSKATTKKDGSSGSGVDMNALMALLGGGQQAPTMVSSGQDNSADIELMQDIFGTSLSAPPAGNTDTRESKLARLLRS